jgi:transposase-like protein
VVVAPPPKEFETRSFPDRDAWRIPQRPTPIPPPSESSVAAALSLLSAQAEPAQNSNRAEESAPVANKKKRPYTRRSWDQDVKAEVIEKALRIKHEDLEKGSKRSGRQKALAQSYGISETTVSNWIVAWQSENPGKRWPNDDGKAPRSVERTVMSRPTPPAPSSRMANGSRDMQTIMHELTQAQDRVRMLKAELREALGD